ncbi:hypothetical protein IHQ11_13265 [Priestia megaterium]|uniref:hypothetical protein n=1 Tax=Priestia megaterium TaxID=1404 RepID=UPI001B39EAD3|nr:hypothetical protein [Priestia megaterium]MBQ4867468.1 hypothetical protein [Priestia megaterium]
MLNFETKYLIRWGIPGWVFIVFSYISLLIYESKSAFIKDFTVTQMLGILISLGFVGVVIGYLMHQIYFSIKWIYSKQSSKILKQITDLVTDKAKLGIECHEFDHHKAYFMMEFQWQKQLVLTGKDNREYIADRYRYLLTTVHALGALLVSLSASTLVTIIFLLSHLPNNSWGGDDTSAIGILSLLLFLIFSVTKLFKYYSENLIFFQANFFNSFFADDFKKKDSCRERIEIGSTSSNAPKQ